MPYCRQANIWPKANIYLWHKATYDVYMTQDTPSRSLDKVIVRLPDGMRDRIREAAEKNNRSMNAEIVSRLEVSFAPPPRDNIEKLPLRTQQQIREFVNFLTSELIASNFDDDHEKRPAPTKADK